VGSVTGPLAAADRRVVVVGSVNADYVVRVPRRPGPGETIGGAAFDLLPGGKGANQAVAAARCGALVSLVARVGDDALGSERLAQLAAEGIDTSAVGRTTRSRTGAAFITVTPDGENTIVVAPGANDELGADDVEASAALIGACALLVAQLEISLDTVQRATELAAAETTVLLNVAPYRPLPASVLSRVDVLVANELEAASLCGVAVAGVDDALQAARRIAGMGPRSVVVTLGASGAVLASPEGELHVPAPRVEVLDTTGAGDALVGALAARLASGEQIAEALAVGVAVGSATTERLGALPIVPGALASAGTSRRRR
jgi:ribokinase